MARCWRLTKEWKALLVYNEPSGHIQDKNLLKDSHLTPTPRKKKEKKEKEKKNRELLDDYKQK